MANLDKLLRNIEATKAQAEKIETYPLTVAGETFDVKTMTRREIFNFLYAQEVNKANMTVGDVIKNMKPFIYKSLELAPLAAKAKEEGLINSYYDVIEALFEPAEIIEIIEFITKINRLDPTNIDVMEGLEEIKKQ